MMTRIVAAVDGEYSHKMAEVAMVMAVAMSFPHVC